MGLKKLDSEYKSRYKSFPVHRPVTIKAKVGSHPSNNAPEELESSRRAGLLSSQFSSVTEPALQRKRIVPYKHNHNILSTSTVKELNNKEWLEAVGDDEEENTPIARPKREEANKTKPPEYTSIFGELKIENDCPVNLESITKKKRNLYDPKKIDKKSSALPGPHGKEKSPDRLPPAGISTYISDPRDKRLLHPSDDLRYPMFQEGHESNSQTEYTEKYKGKEERNMLKPIVRAQESSNIDMATYKKVLLQRNDAYGLSSRPVTTVLKEKQTPVTIKKKARKNLARKSSAGSTNSGSFVSAKGDQYVPSKAFVISKKSNEGNITKDKDKEKIIVPQRDDLDGRSLSSITSNDCIKTTKAKRDVRKIDDEVRDKLHLGKTQNGHDESLSSFNSGRRRRSEKFKSKERLNQANPRPTFTKGLNNERDFEKGSVSSVRSSNSFERKISKGTERAKTMAENRHYAREADGTRKTKQAWQDRVGSKEGRRGSARTTRNRGETSVVGNERGRSPTPEMRSAGHSRRHHLDITTGSNNPLATGSHPAETWNLYEQYERSVYNPSRYSDVAESQTSSRTLASWSELGS